MLLWKRYGNNKMADMRIMSLILHLQQYSHRLNLLYFLFTSVCMWPCRSVAEGSVVEDAVRLLTVSRKFKFLRMPVRSACVLTNRPEHWSRIKKR